MKRLGLSFILLLAACSPRPGGDSAQGVRERTEAARLRAEAALQNLDRKTVALRDRAESNAREALTDLEEKKTTVLLKLEDLKTTTGAAARDAAEGVEKAAADLEKATKEAADRYK